MQSLNVADAGFSYIFRCIGAYYEGGIYFLLYILSLAFLCLYGGRAWKRVTGTADGAGIRSEDSFGSVDRNWKSVFLPQFILMVLTVYNPVFPVVLNSFFDVNKEYYRFLWMSPVIICTAAAGAVAAWDTATRGSDSSRADESGKKVDIKKDTCVAGLHKDFDMIRGVIASLFVICLLIAGGSYLYKDGYIVSPTVYHMPTEIPGVCAMIHDDADRRFSERKAAAAGTEEEESFEGADRAYPKAMFEYDYQMQVRQYDAGILLSCDREEYLRAVSGEVNYETAMEDGNYADRLLAVAGLGIEIDPDYFISALEHTGTEYIVVTTGSGKVSYLQGAGLSVIGETENHTVLHYEPEVPSVFSPADYSEVWRLTPQWYDFLI